MSGDENLWYVKTPDGDVHRVTLDQLDEAFQAGRIDENVMVLAAGATKWAKLGALAGLDEPPASVPVASSIRPVSMDLSLDVDENAFRKKSHKGVVIGAVVGLLAVFGGILVLNRAHLGSDTPAAAAATPATAAAVVAPPPVPAAAPAPPPDPAPTTTAPVLSDDQKAKLAAADKAMEQKTKSKKKNRASYGGGGHGSPKIKSQGFTTGGNKFDPLNASF
jgi:hypothetical protein